MSQPSYTVKALRATFTLTGSNAVFAGTSANVLSLTGLRMTAIIKGAGLPAFPEATLRIYGMSQQDMNSLAIVVVQGGKPEYTPNTVTIEADSGAGFAFIFAGQIFQAGPDYSNLPDVSLFVHAQAGGFDQLSPAQPTSYPVGVPVATIISNIAAKMSLSFENDGVTAVASGNPYYAGTLTDQLKTVCAQYNINSSVELNLLTISPAGVARTAIPSFTLSPGPPGHPEQGSGLVGYPEVLGNGYLNVRALFNPAFRLNGAITIQGSDVTIDPALPKTLNSLADGNWVIGPITHTLEALKPNGAWFTDMKLYPPNAVPAES